MRTREPAEQTEFVVTVKRVLTIVSRKTESYQLRDWTVSVKNDMLQAVPSLNTVHATMPAAYVVIRHHLQSPA